MKNFKKVIALGLSFTLAMSTVAFASEATPKEWNTDGGESTVEGYAGVIQPTIEVALPGELFFELDPVQINSNHQIFGYDYNVVNYGNVNVKVNVAPKVSAGEGVTDLAAGTLPAQLDDHTGYKADMAAVTDKRAVVIAAIVADGSGTSAEADLVDVNEDGIYEFAYTGNATTLGRAKIAYNEDGSVNYGGIAQKGSATAAAANDGVITLTLGTASDFDIFLEKGDATELAKESPDYNKAFSKSASSFTFVGAVDPHSTFYDGELVASAKYTLTVYTGTATRLLTETTANGGENNDISTAKKRMVVPKS